MSAVIARTRFSVLDRSRTRAGRPPAEALRDTVALAREAEALGYHRFWVSEHHGVPGVAGSAPTVLAAAVAAATRTVRVGTGGVMLPNHQPLVVAGTSPTGVHARPAEGLRVPPFVLAMGEGARIAARAGLPMVIGDLRRRERMMRGIDEYRSLFRPSPWASAPYVVISGTVAVAGSEDARRLLVPEAWATAYARTHGTFPPLVPAGEIEARAMPAKERDLYESALAGQLAGTADQVADELETVLKETGAAEVLVTTSTYDRAALLDSYRRLAALFAPGR
ncbi:LLM class flavin-dependent oxidoreductase [Streptomyces sp. SAS_269]|uniref:LLM class flavin-dependent oxidoreductase n=1 Tax=Streptomyces sp. SAS_269 TaxID=3412749 RepID=UPI00403D30B0